MGVAAHLVVPTTGFEPVTCRLGGGRSILLSYDGVVVGAVEWRRANYLVTFAN